MSLKHCPAVGAILMCEFPSCFSAPEMVKTRPVVVLSPRIKGREGLVSIVPLSTTPPNPAEAHHCQVPIHLLPKSLQATCTASWAKCDLVYTLSLSRLTLVQGKRDPKTGKRAYEQAKVDLATLQNLRRCAAIGLGIGVELWPDAAATPAAAQAMPTPTAADPKAA